MEFFAHAPAVVVGVSSTLQDHVEYGKLSLTLLRVCPTTDIYRCPHECRGNSNTKFLLLSKGQYRSLRTPGNSTAEILPMVCAMYHGTALIQVQGWLCKLGRSSKLFISSSSVSEPRNAGPILYTTEIPYRGRQAGQRTQDCAPFAFYGFASSVLFYALGGS